MAIQTTAGQHCEYESAGIRNNNMPAESSTEETVAEGEQERK
jgi:hypothetical protein